ncbi:MFS transporter [Labrenzia sp. OB1]|uniref:MFS transporter n=1 Tax=Labrenzia sp. OB1 TaxID=1561204 RepID=UPI0007B2A333|nr:MFS transporter [Labrenzia sp. OB1]KZM50634.1 NreB protein [Labrenzia sp. OB1]
MLNPLRHSTFRFLFASQVLSLTGVGLMTAGLSLAAWRIGGASHAGPILGLFFALKMIAYVGFSPLAQAALTRIPRLRALVGLDVARLLFMVPLAFVSSWWTIAGLAFLFFAVSSAFTPLFQAMIPAVLPDKETYSEALALSRIAYTLESILTPILVGAALLFLHTEYLFALAALGFIGSAVCLLLSRSGKEVRVQNQDPFLTRAVRGLWIYARTPRLRGLFVLNFGLSLVMAWILVDTIVYAGTRFEDAEQVFPWLMGGYGVGAALMAFALPALLRVFSERRVMAAGTFLFAMLSPLILLQPALPELVVLWALFGAACTLTLTPGGLILTRSASDADRPAVFAAQFSLSHAGWLVAYPLAGWLGAAFAPATALIILAILAVLVTLAGLAVWPAKDPDLREHSHPNLPPDHPHIVTSHRGVHAHPFYIDELHPRWDA